MRCRRRSCGDAWKRAARTSELAVVAVAVLAMGIWPKPFVDVMHVSVIDLLAHVAKSKL